MIEAFQRMCTTRFIQIWKMFTFSTKNGTFRGCGQFLPQESLKYLELTNFPACGTTENEIYGKIWLRKSLLEKVSIVRSFLLKPERFCQDFCCRGHRRLKKTCYVFFTLLYRKDEIIVNLLETFMASQPSGGLSLAYNSLILPLMGLE